MSHEIALLVEAQGIGSLDGQLDSGRIGAGRDNKVVFQLALVAVINHVHARVHIPVMDLGVVRDIGAPLLGIVPLEVVALAGQLVGSFHFRGGVRA